MTRLYKIALLITLINVLLMVGNTILTLYVCDCLAGVNRRVAAVEKENGKVINMLQIDESKGVDR